MTLYDSIGRDYAKTRVADHRIAGELIKLLALPRDSIVLDVGAGTGKYSAALADYGYRMLALEPSMVMQAQHCRRSEVRYIKGFAERIPLPDGSVDGVIVVLALHHFEDRASAVAEMIRVAGKGPVVLFAFDLPAFRRFWLSDYFPELGLHFRSSFSESRDVAAELQKFTARKVSSVCFPLPPDLKDQFGAASWAVPEAYLDPEIRNGISDFALMEKAAVARGVERLKSDLDSGAWDATYGHLRGRESYEVGYKFIVIEGVG